MKPEDFRAPFLSRISVKNEVEKFVNQFGDGWEYPLDVELLAEDIGLRLKLLPDIEQRYNQLAMLSGDLKFIQIEESLFLNDRYVNRYRFSIAHELGHWYLHSNLFKKVEYRNASEWAEFLCAIPDDEKGYLEIHANRFASELLVPTNLLIPKVQEQTENIKAYIKLLPDANATDTIDYIAPRIALEFGVSEQTMINRIKNEEIIEKYIDLD